MRYLINTKKFKVVLSKNTEKSVIFKIEFFKQMFFNRLYVSLFTKKLKILIKELWELNKRF